MGDWVMSENIKDMTPKLIGETYLRKPRETSRQRCKYGIYRCQYCGKEFEAGVAKVKRGHTKSCGCLRGDAHGLASHRFYKTWHNMIQRCTNPNHKAYKDYGARGITVCEEWVDVANFVAWAEATYPNTEGMSLDRIDNDKGYSPENCRWVDRATQGLNQRMKKNNTSGYVGICWVESKLKWVSRISVEKKSIWLGDYKIIEEAVLARDNYIIENKLPHKLNLKQENINE